MTHLTNHSLQRICLLIIIGLLVAMVGVQCVQNANFVLPNIFQKFTKTSSASIENPPITVAKPGLHPVVKKKHSSAEMSYDFYSILSKPRPQTRPTEMMIKN